MKSAQPQQPEKRKKEDRSKQAKAGGGAAAQTKKKSSSPNKTPILLIAVLLVCGGAGALAYVLLQGSRYLPPECNSDGTSKVEQPVTIGMCRSAVCSFEVSKCTQPCPFGYLKESLTSACAKSCVCASEGQFQGDVQIDNEEIPKLLEEFGYIEEEETEFSLFVGSAIKGWNPKFTWKAKIKKDTGRLVIGYTMTDDLKSSAKTRKAFQDAFKSYKEDSCIDFEPYDKNKHIPNKIAFKKGKGCWSYVGMKDPKRGNPVSIGKGCDHPQTVMHELLHALGFLHEQSRPDRDNFVTVNLQNVFKNFEGNFVKAKAEHMIDLKSPYDFKSIMHYNGFSFSKNRQPTLTKKDTGAAVTNPKPVNKLGGEDLKELNTLFCENAKPSTGGGTTTASPRTTRQPVITTRAPVVPTTRRPLVTTKKWPYTTRSPATTRATTRAPWRPNPTTRATTRTPWQPNPTTRATTRTPWQPNPTTRSTWQPHPTTRKPWQPNPTTRSTWQPHPTTRKPWQPNPTTISTWQPHPTTRRPWQPNPTTRNPWRPLPTASWSTFKPWTRRTTAPRLIPSGHGGQTAWHAWVGCSATCGTGGIKYRVRYCLEPSRGCSKPHFRTQPCQQQRCSQNADRWSKWTPYGACSKTCGYGIRVRYRRCSGARCPGNPLQAAPCSSQTCSGGTIAKTSWGPWFNWGSCTRQCGSGLRVRRRSCMKGNQFGYGCRGRSGAMEQCNTHKCGSAMSADPSKTMFAWESQTVSTLCSGAESNLLWVFGDFNGDGNMDVMCGSQFGTFMIGLAMYSGGIGESSWSGNMNGCVEKPGQIAAADFNGDGKSDVICTNPTKKKTIIRFSDNGQFTGDGYEGNFCAEKGDELLVVDNDGDGKSDLICRHRSGAYDMLLNQFIG